MCLPACASPSSSFLRRASIRRASRPGRAWRAVSSGWAGGCSTCRRAGGRSKRGADAGVWRQRPQRWGFRLEPPVLAVEVAGQDEGADALLEKARWYLAQAVAVVWVVLPGEREVIVVTASGERRHAVGERLAAHPELPGLQPEVADLFRQVSPR